MLRLNVTLLLIRVTFGGHMPNITYPNGLATVWPEDSEQAPIHAYFTPPSKKRYNTKWLLLWQGDTGIDMSLQEQAKMQDPLTQTEYRVRDWLIGEIGIGNYVFVNQAECGRQLRIARTHVSAAIKRLISLGILLKGPKSGRSNTYMVNPAFCFSGALNNGIKQRNEAIKQARGRIIKFSKNCDD